LFRRAFDEGDKEAQNAVYKHYKKLMFDWVYKNSAAYALTEQDIEDIASEAMIKFFKGLKQKKDFLKKYKHIAQILAYGKRCAKSAVIDLIRKKARQKRNQEEWLKEVFELSSPSPEEEVQHSELRQQVQELVKKHVTDPQEMRYIELKFVYGLSPKEIVKRFGHEFAEPRILYRLDDRIKKRLKPLFKSSFNY
jgi:RNA polymerase sigma factor (sigma-70 family)